MIIPPIYSGVIRIIIECFYSREEYGNWNGVSRENPNRMSFLNVILFGETGLINAFETPILVPCF
jgi:hypothetical protein